MHKTFGLIGKSLQHSFSKNYFTEKFKQEKLTDFSYQNFELSDIAEFSNLIADNSLSGLNVTIPYKESVLPYLDVLSDVVKQIGACNTIQFIPDSYGGKKTIGHNTDVTGFQKSLASVIEDYHTKALVFGSGGAAKAVEFVLDRIECQSIVVSRNPTAENEIGYNNISENLLKECLLIINTTPLGMYPDTSTFPDFNYNYLNKFHVCYDLVYNPKETVFLQKAKQQGATIKNGLEMLEIQAEESWKIWNS